MCRPKKNHGGRRCAGQATEPVIDAATDMLGAAAREDGSTPPQFRSEGYYILRRAARAAWASALHGIRARLVREGIDPDSPVPVVEAQEALRGAQSAVEGMGWLSAPERATAARRLSRAQRQARSHPISRLVLSTLLHVVAGLILGRERARSAFALAGLVQRAREDRERDREVRRAAAKAHESEMEMQHWQETFADTI